MKILSRCLMLVVIGLALLAGCAQPRSREAFCDTLAQEKQRYRDTYSERLDRIGRDGDLSLSVALGTSHEALRDVAATLDKLERVAPEEIRPDVEALRDALQRQRDALKGLADNPLGALAGSLTSGLATMSSWAQVSTYVEQNCGTRL